MWVNGKGVKSIEKSIWRCCVEETKNFEICVYCIQARVKTETSKNWDNS